MQKLALLCISYLNQEPCATTWKRFASISIHSPVLQHPSELVPGTNVGMPGRHRNGQEGESHLLQTLPHSILSWQLWRASFWSFPREQRDEGNSDSKQGIEPLGQPASTAPGPRESAKMSITGSYQEEWPTPACNGHAQSHCAASRRIPPSSFSYKTVRNALGTLPQRASVPHSGPALSPALRFSSRTFSTQKHLLVFVWGENALAVQMAYWRGPRGELLAATHQGRPRPWPTTTSTGMYGTERGLERETVCKWEKKNI